MLWYVPPNPPETPVLNPKFDMPLPVLFKEYTIPSLHWKLLGLLCNFVV